MFHNSFVYESCSICRQRLTDSKDIFVSVESDQYICLDCATENGIIVVECLEY